MKHAYWDFDALSALLIALGLFGAPVWAEAQAGVELFAMPARDGIRCNAVTVEDPDDSTKVLFQYAFNAPATGDTRRIELFTDTAGSPLMVSDTWFDWSGERPPVLALAVVARSEGSLRGRHLIVDGRQVPSSLKTGGGSAQLAEAELAAASALMRFLVELRCPTGSASDRPHH